MLRLRHDIYQLFNCCICEIHPFFVNINKIRYSRTNKIMQAQVKYGQTNLLEPPMQSSACRLATLSTVVFPVHQPPHRPSPTPLQPLFCYQWLSSVITVFMISFIVFLIHLIKIIQHFGLFSKIVKQTVQDIAILEDLYMT